MMKWMIILSGIVLMFLIATQIYAMSTQNDIETYAYKVVKTYDRFEVRTYDEQLFTAVQMDGSRYRDVSGRGFSILANYIFGGNDRNQKIAMTSPVSVSLEDSSTMMFMVPRSFTKEMLPKPDRQEIEFRVEPAKTMAAISFGGWANDSKISKYREILIEELEKAGIDHTGKFYFFGYNAPFELFNRRNEVVVELAGEPDV